MDENKNKVVDYDEFRKFVVLVSETKQGEHPEFTKDRDTRE